MSSDGRPFEVSLEPDGELDTSAPISDRKPGTLVQATDVAPDYLGPRRGSESFTRIWEAPGTASLYDEITLDGGSSYGNGYSNEDQFRDLGLTTTLDIWFRLTETTYASAATGIGLYAFALASGGLIELSIYGPAHVSAGKILATIITNPTRTTVDSTITITGATAIVAGSSQQHKYHVRLVRNAKNGYLYLNGVEDGTTTSLIGTSPIYGDLDTAVNVYLGHSTLIADTTIDLKGQLYGAVLRDGAFLTHPIEAVMPTYPLARNIHHYYLGRNYALGGADHYYDMSRYGVHARVTGSGHSTSAANDNAAPSPAPVQGLVRYTTRTNRSVVAVAAGGNLSTTIIS